MKPGLFFATLLLLTAATTAHAQVLVANDDTFGIPFGESLVVEATGVLANDTLDGEPAGENGASAHLVTDVNHGTLVLNPNGSFTYSPGVTFDGTDEFVYSAQFGVVSDQATVTLSACMGGPDVFTCWNESAFLATALYWGFDWIQESFEDDAAWGTARAPSALASVSSQGIRWQSNHADSPAFNPITTGTGPARTGVWGVYDPNHGYATGTAGQCDIDVPPDHCLFHDGITGIREPGLSPLFGVGGYITGTYGAKVGIVVDGRDSIGGGVVGTGHQFFGVIDMSGLGFSQFEFLELDGKVGQELFIWADDFTVLTPIPTAVSPVAATQALFRGAAPNPSFGNTTFQFSLPIRANVRLTLYDVRGRLVRELIDEVRGPGAHAVPWNGRDRNGLEVSSGVYFGRLVVGSNGAQTVLSRRVVVLQ